MKLLIVNLLVLCSLSNVYAQNEGELKIESTFTLKVSNSFYQRNPKTEDYFYNLTGIHPESRNADFNRNRTIDIQINKSTKYDYLDLLAGYTFTEYNGFPSFHNQDYQFTYFEEKFNGAGVFAGVRPHYTKKYWGLFTELAIGIYSYEERVILKGVTKQSIPVSIDTSYSNISNGLGGHSVIGGRLQYKRIGIEIGLRTLISGGENASFFLQGIDYGITFRFN